MIIDQPCVSCGITLQKGAKIVSVVDIIKGILGIIICSVLMVHFKPGPHVVKADKHSCDGGVSCEDSPVSIMRVEVTKEKIITRHYDLFWISLLFLSLSAVEILLAILLFYGATKKSVPLLHFWLIMTGFLTPVNIFLMKIYEMIVVFAFTEDLTCEAGGKALEEFRKLPYTCNIQTQLYPSPVFGPESPNWTSGAPPPRNGNNMERRSSTIYLSDKSFLMNVNTSVFSMVQHQRY